MKVIDDASVILNQVSKKSAAALEKGASGSQTRGSEEKKRQTMKKTKSSQAITETAQNSLYGLDIDILKSLQLDGLLEEENKKKAAAAAQENDSPASDSDRNNEAASLMNKTLTELRQEHGMEPGLHTAANKLRMRCSFY